MLAAAVRQEPEGGLRAQEGSPVRFSSSKPLAPRCLLDASNETRFAPRTPGPRRAPALIMTAVAAARISRMVIRGPVAPHIPTPTRAHFAHGHPRPGCSPHPHT